MRFKTILRLAIAIAVIYVGVQFASVYVTRTQLGHILETTAIEARRDNLNRSEIKQALIKQMNQTNTDLPMEMEISIDGLDDRKAKLRIELDYTHRVDLLSWPVTLSMTASGDSVPAL